MKIAIMGTGGTGGYFGGRLAHAGLDVTFIARGQHLQAIRENGLQVKSPNGDFLVKPAKATDNPAEVGPVDLILFCVKAYDAASAAEQIKPMVGSQTAILPILNGIDHVAAMGAIVGAEHVLGGQAAITAHRIAPGVIEQTDALDRIEFGEMGGGVSPRCQAIEQELARGGFTIRVVPNVVERMWWKLMVLAGAGVCSVVRGDFGLVLRTPETAALARAAMVEAVTVAQRKGIGLTDAMPDEVIAQLKTMSTPDRPSMLVDLEHGRRLEIESLNGAVSRMGKELGVHTPVNDFIYACLKPWAQGSKRGDG